MRSYWQEHTVWPEIGSVKMGRPVSQQRPPGPPPLEPPPAGPAEDGGPEVAEQGDELRALGGTVTVVTAIATGAVGGEEGADGTVGVVLWAEGEPRKGKCDMVFSSPATAKPLERRSPITVSIIHRYFDFPLAPVSISYLYCFSFLFRSIGFIGRL